MSLLDKGRETVTVYPEKTTTDRDGNTITEPDMSAGVTWRATIQPEAQSGTSARRAEMDAEGFQTESVYTLRLPRDFPFVLNAQSRVDWNGQYWAVIGDPKVYNGSPRTARYEYTIRRS